MGCQSHWFTHSFTEPNVKKLTDLLAIEAPFAADIDVMII